MLRSGVLLPTDDWMELGRDLVTPLPVTVRWELGEPTEAALTIHDSVTGQWQEASGNLVSVPGGRDK